jgi:hypothetical protein
MALVVVVLLTVWYVACAACFVFGCGAGWVAPTWRDAAYPVFAPLDRYVVNHYTGSGFIVDTMNSAAKAGNDFIR